MTETVQPRKAWTRAGTAVERAIPGLTGESATAVGLRARLRRGVGRAAGSVPDLWEVTYWSKDVSRPDLPTYEEQAVHDAVCLFAMHQQGHGASSPMHRPGVTLGTAVQRLARVGGLTEDEKLVSSPVYRRFTALGTASTMSELLTHLRGLVAQMRSEGIALDYALLADDLSLWNSAERRDGIVRTWGRHFFARERMNISDASGTGGDAGTTATSEDR